MKGSIEDYLGSPQNFVQKHSKMQWGYGELEIWRTEVEFRFYLTKQLVEPGSQNLACRPSKKPVLVNTKGFFYLCISQ